MNDPTTRDFFAGISSFWLPIVLVLVGYLSLLLINFITTRSSRLELTEKEKELRGRVRSMETTIGVLSRELEKKDAEGKDQRDLIQEQHREIIQLKALVTELESKQVSLQKQSTLLEEELRAKNVIEPKEVRLPVLGIWPEPPMDEPDLDIKGEKDALYNAGFTFVELSGASANIDGVVRELDRFQPKILEIGCHDDGQGNPVLSDGPTEPGWWGDLIEGKDILLAVLLYCRSNQQDRLNVADALLRGGAKAVVSFNKPVADGQAIRFARMLYEKLSERQPIDQAFQRAKLVVNRNTRDNVQLRTKGRQI